MNLSLTPTQNPTYDLGTIFRPYVAEFPADFMPAPIAHIAAPICKMHESTSSRGATSLYNLDLARMPLLDSEEPLMSWLLRASGAVSDVVMRDALELSRNGSVALTEILQLSGRISHSDLRALDRAIFYVSNSSIYRGFAALALSHSLAHFVDFDEALWDLGLHPNDPFNE